MSPAQTIPTLVNSFQYNILYHLLEDEASEDLKKLIKLGVLSLDFDFPRAKELYEQIKDGLDPAFSELLELNFRDIDKGDPDAVFSELLWSLRIQLIQGQGADFLGRVYRFNEAYFKYIFARHELEGDIDLFNVLFEEDRILNRLRRKYKIGTGNIIFGVERYIRQHHKWDKKVLQAIDRLTSPKMKAIVELRHESVVGHGFQPASIERIKEIFPDPQELVQKMRQALEDADVRIYDSKYDRLNRAILDKVAEEKL
ncbi:MAG TPA: hypothetical protein GXZ74_06100 [Tissierellia bacterium]|nr:hypothetical protein [Tissierellia bacterium]